MPSLSEKLKRLLDNIALTDAGEMLSPREKKRLLDLMVPSDRQSGTRDRTPLGIGETARQTSQPLLAQRRSVVLGVGHSVSLAALDYAAGACARLDAGLVLLCTDAALAKRLLETHVQRLAASGVTCRIAELHEPSPAAVAEFIQKDSGVLFAVTAGDDPVAALVQRSPKGAFKTPPAPIVMVTDVAAEQPGTLEVRRFKRGSAQH